jgi:hypothetical protein
VRFKVMRRFANRWSLGKMAAATLSDAALLAIL